MLSNPATYYLVTTEWGKYRLRSYPANPGRCAYRA